MSAWVGAILGGAVGLAFAVIIVTIALNQPETFRQNGGRKTFSDMDPARRRRTLVLCVSFGVFVVAGAAGMGAWALPAFQ